MRSLEIPPPKIFNNLIKQNQKLDCDSLLKQPTTVSSVQSPSPKVQRLVSRVQRPASRVQGPEPESRIRQLASRVQGPVSNICVQSSRIPVCLFDLLSALLRIRPISFHIQYFQLPADLVTFTEEILNGKLHFLCSDWF